jgi:PIN domain nuclease of toxin-antitoxin system
MQAGSLPIHREHLAVYAHLATHHQNPFERMLVAQAMNEGLVIVSGNPVFRKYPVTVLW